MSFFEDNMPTTFMGRDNNNNPCYHVRKTNGLSADAMKSGVQDDTLFHSSLPYLQVLEDVSVGKTSTLNWTATSGSYNIGVQHNFDIFTIPTSVRNYLANKYACILVCTYSDGSQALIDINPYISGYRSIDPGGGGIPTRYSAFASVVANSPTFGTIGWWALPTVPTSEAWSSASGVLPPGVFSNTSNASITLNNNIPTVLTNTSQSLIFHRGNGTYIGSPSLPYVEKAVSPVPSSIRFLVLNVTVTDTMTMLGVGASTSGDIKITESGLYISGVNVLSGKTFLRVNNLDCTAGASGKSGFTGSPKLSNLPTTHPPFGYRAKITLPFSNTAMPNICGVTQNILGINGGTITSIDYYRIRNQTPNSINASAYSTIENSITAAKGVYMCDTFSTLTVPSSVSSCVFNSSTLYVNGQQIFSSEAPFIYPSTSGARSIDISSYTLTASAVQDTTTVLATFNVAAANNRLSMLYNANRFSSANMSAYDTTTGGTLTYTMTARTSYDNLGMKLVSLSEGQICHILTFVDNVAHNDNNLGKGVSITYMFRRAGNTVQLLRHVLVTTDSGSSTLVIPGLKINYMQLASAF